MRRKRNASQPGMGEPAPKKSPQTSQPEGRQLRYSPNIIILNVEKK